MHVVCVSYYYDRFLTSPGELLDRYETLTGWSEGLVSAGARVSVVQRFGCDTEVIREGAVYRFVHDPARQFGGPADFARRVNQAVAALEPDVVHVNGMHFVRQTARLKRLLPRIPI